MARVFLFGTVLVAVLATGPVHAQDTTTTVEPQPRPMAQASGTDDERRANVTDSAEIAGHKVLLITIARWLSANFDLPLVLDPPRLARVPRAKMVTLLQMPKDHPAGVPTDNAQSGTMAPNDIVAVYSDVEGTIYLPEGWTGETAVELSILVHEMVHHIQHVGGLTYACRGAREKVAYAAQNGWLQLFGRDLESEFGIDPFTLLVNSSCIH